MAGIGYLPPPTPMGGIGAALIAGSQGYMDQKEALRVQAQQDQDRKRRQEREDFTFDRIKDAALAEDEQDAMSLIDLADEKLDPIKEALDFLQIPENPRGVTGKGSLPMPITHGAGSASGETLTPEAEEPEVTVDSVMTPEKQIVARQFKEIEGDYVKFRNRVAEDIRRIRERTAGDEEAFRRQAAAYKRALDNNPKWKEVSGKYDNAMNSAIQLKKTETSTRAIEAMFRGDTQALKDLGFVNADGSPMEIEYSNGVPVALKTAMGPIRMRSAITWALVKNGSATFKELADDIGKDQADYDKLKEQEERTALARQKANKGGGSGGGSGDGKDPAAMKMAREITRTQSSIRMLEAADPTGKDPKIQNKLKELRDYERNLREESKNSKTGLEDREDDRDRKSVSMDANGVINLLKRDAKDPGRKPPSGLTVAQEYERIRDSSTRYGKEHAERMKQAVLGSWSKDQQKQIQAEMDAYWSNRSKGNTNYGGDEDFE